MSAWLCIKEGDDTMYINVSSIRKISIRDPGIRWLKQRDVVHPGGVPDKENYEVELAKLLIVTEENPDDIEYHIHVEAHEASNLIQGMQSGVFSPVTLNVINVDEPKLRPAS